MRFAEEIEKCEHEMHGAVRKAKKSGEHSEIENQFQNYIYAALRKAILETTHKRCGNISHASQNSCRFKLKTKGRETWVVSGSKRVSPRISLGRFLEMIRV